MKRFGHELLSAFFLVGVVFAEQRSQVFSANGNVRTVERPVSYASVTFIDKNDTTRRYSTVTDTSGNYWLDVTTRVTSQVALTPQAIELAQNYPNPFSSSTAISYKLNRQSDVSIRIYNILGQEIKAWTVGSQAAGTHGLLWDGKDNFGKKVSLGIYFYQLQGGNETHVKKMLFCVGGMNVSASILQSGPSQTIELKKEKKAWHHDTTVRTFRVQIANLDCTTTPQIATKQFDNIAVQSDTILDFVVSPAAAQPPPPVYPAPYSSVVWHPDGRIAFNWTKMLKINRCTGGVSVRDIDQDSTGFWMIHGDRTGLQKLLSYGLTSPAWSYDGQWIAFGAVQIHKMKFTGTQFDTTTTAQLTTQGRNFHPAWSPTGQWVAYDSDDNSPNGMNFIWKMKADGSQKQRITYEPAQGETRMPFWSPDDKQIAHIRYMVGVSSSEIFLMDISGSNPNRLTFNDATDYYPKYSPDGTKIAFLSQTSNDIPQLWVMNSDGTNQQQLTTQGADLFFSWSPDGTRLVYVQHDYRKADRNNGTLWIMNADGSDKRQLTFNYGLVFVP